MNAPGNAAPNNRPTLRAADFQEAVALAEKSDNTLIEVFLTEWSEVDRRRDQAASLGLSGRLVIHHQAALDALVHLNVLSDSPQEPPAPGAARGTTSRLLWNFLHAASALCRTRFIIVFN